MKVRRALLFALLVLLLTGSLLIACGSSVGSYESTPEPKHVLTGTFLLRRESCSYVSKGYSDIAVGTQVVIKDGKDNVLGIGRLSDPERSSDPFGCAYSFLLTDLPKADVYGIEVSRRGKLLFTYGELENKGWKLSLSLGD